LNEIIVGTEHHKSSQPCFCGKGTIVSTWTSSDWSSNSDVKEEMNCPTCAKNYEFKIMGYRSDDHSPRTAWVLKPEGKTKKQATIKGR